MSKKNVMVEKVDSKNAKWTLSVTTLAFFISLLLSIMSQSILNRMNIIVALSLLLVFLFFNVISDMLGLAITSCKIEKLTEMTDKRKITCIASKLINNADKVSSILCDVVGDICGILCGVSGSIFSIMLSSLLVLDSFKIIIGAVISAFIASLTVLLKAISKNYAINHSSKIVLLVCKFISKFSK